MRQNSSHIRKSKTLIKEGFFDVLSNLFKKPEQESNTPDELNQYLQQLQDTLDENEIYDEEVSKLVDQLKDSDYIDLVDFPTMIRGLENKLLKSGDKNVIIADYLTRLLKSLPKRAKYEKNLLKGEIPSTVDYYDEVEQEKSRVPKKVFKTEKELLQIELLKLQEWVKKNNVPVAIVFEGRDTAGKGSAIKQITEYLDPKYFNIVALGIPTEEEKKNWFKRYEKYIEPGKITFFDRSWYNRGIVEPVMGYSSKEEYEQFMKEVVPFEKSSFSNTPNGPFHRMSFDFFIASFMSSVRAWSRIISFAEISSIFFSAILDPSNVDETITLEGNRTLPDSRISFAMSDIESSTRDDPTS